MVESSSFGNSSGDSFRASSFSEQVFGFSVMISFMVFGLRTNTCSNGLILMAAAAVLRTNSNRARPAFPRSMIIDFSALNLSLIVLIRRSIFPFLRWSPIGHSMCLKECSLQNCLNASPRNIVVGFVLILLECQAVRYGHLSSL